MLAPPRRITVRYEGLTAADGNRDKASINKASDLPWELSGGASNLTESFEDDKSSISEGPFPQKTASPRKRSKKETSREESGEKKQTKRMSTKKHMPTGSGETDGGTGGRPPPWSVISKFLGPLSPHC